MPRPQQQALDVSAGPTVPAGTDPFAGHDPRLKETYWRDYTAAVDAFDAARTAAGRDLARAKYRHAFMCWLKCHEPALTPAELEARADQVDRGLRGIG